ncbi:hypothetical protein [Stenomitos frigidus]|uniref:Uncharacterized protein n=1 Tax=Stenomitos frigidus ULC18 TaxID=2107698 RepID=A0A2T1E3G8_9CYAN|nr:hypothetical protein [Stenomitos frigidus]PSB27292.1 hypothetical protein C7B82_16735 [Stenomitos frigidus ULC18]
MIKQISPLLLALSVVLLQPSAVTAQEMMRVSPTAPTNQQQVMTVKDWAGRATAIDFSAVHQRITSVVLGDSSRLVYTADVPLESGQASTLFLKQIQPLKFPGATTATLTNLLIKTIDAQGKQQLHSFNVVAAHGTPEYSNVQMSRTAAKTNSIAPTLSTPELLKRVEAGIQVAIARRYAMRDDPLFERVRQCTADARSGTPVAIAAKRANVSLALLLKLSQLGLQAIR